jgi:DNA-binding transcriptional ArsR family regulator
MCGGWSCCNSKAFSKFLKYFKALHCPTRWIIIRFLGTSARSTNEIFEGLKEAGETVSRSGLYYHLSELEEAGIIELAEYREIGGGAPEKVWRLKTKEIRVNLLTDLPEVSNHEC